jgi:putative tributyrin esterase
MNSSEFRTIEISDSRFEAEGLRLVTVKSRALGNRADMTLFVPRQVAEGMPLVILLHGVYGSHWAWALKGGAHRTTAALIEKGEIPPMVVAMPSDGLWGDGSGYLPHRNANFERWIVEEVPAAAAAAEPRLGKDFPVFINGLSMGGFGALRLAAKYPERFRAAGGHSSMTHFDQFPMFVEEPLDKYACAPEDRSVLDTMKKNRGRLPPLRFDCGTEDQLIQFNRELDRELTKAGIDHVYEEFPGAHSWGYWELHLAEMLRFFGKQISG